MSIFKESDAHEHISRLFKARDKPKNSLFGNAYSFFFDGTASSKAVNERTAMQSGPTAIPL